MLELKGLSMLIIDSFKQYKGLPREVYIIALQRFITSLGGFVYPFLTLFMTQKLGLTDSEAGLWLLISAVVGMPGSLIAGVLIDRMNRKGIMVLTRGLFAVIILLCGFMPASMIIIYMVIGANFISSFAQPASSAMMSDLTEPSNRKQSFSLLYLAMNMGLAFSFLMAGYLFNHQWRLLFIGDGITTILGLIPFMLYVRESKPTEEEVIAIDASNREGEKTVEGSVFMALLHRPYLFWFVIINTFVGFVYHQHGFLMPLHLTELFPADGAVYFGHIMSMNTVLVIVFTPIIMAATRNMPPIINVTIASITYVFGFGMMAFASSLPWFYVAVLIWTMGEIIATVNTGVYISNHSPVNHRGRFSSVIGLIQFSGRSGAPAIMGLYLMSHTKSEAWLLAGAIALACAIAFYLLYTIEKHLKSKTVMDIESL